MKTQIFYVCKGLLFLKMDFQVNPHFFYSQWQLLTPSKLQKQFSFNHMNYGILSKRSSLCILLTKKSSLIL